MARPTSDQMQGSPFERVDHASKSNRAPTRSRRQHIVCFRIYIARPTDGHTETMAHRRPRAWNRIAFRRKSGRLCEEEIKLAPITWSSVRARPERPKLMHHAPTAFVLYVYSRSTSDSNIRCEYVSRASDTKCFKLHLLSNIQ